DQILGIMDFSILDSDEISEEILDLFEKRNNFKKEKNWEEADKIREILLEKGYKIIDNRDGSFLERI
ncbi:cysteine--tRNA ligase, partial [Candidatus Gracilibacteria bacterium]